MSTPTLGYTIGGAASGTTTSPLPVASTIDGTNDYLPIYTNSLTATQAINRNTLLGLGSAPVGLTDTQTVTNKTLTSPTINSPTITNATISANTLTGYTTSNTGTIYGISVTTGAISSALTMSSTLGVTGAVSLSSTLGVVGQLSLQTSTAPPSAGATTAGIKISSTVNLGIFFGTGAPTFSAAQGSIYMRTDGSSTSTRLYVNTGGSTTWTNFTSAA